MSVKKLLKGFTILELMLSMMIFTIMGMTLYSMMDALTRLQTTSLGLQRYMNEGHNMLDKLATEISMATTEPLYLYDVAVSNENSFTPEFVCIPRTDAIPSGSLFFQGEGTKPAKEYVQQLYYTVIDQNLSMESATSSGEDQVQKYLESMKNKIFWDEVLVKERVLYMSTGLQLWLYTRTEKKDNTNVVNGKADCNLTGGFSVPPLPFHPMPVYHVEYLFWGNKSKDWGDNGDASSPQPIRSWDSRVKEEVNGVVIHEKGELPRAMKILLTLNYNPEMYDKREEHLDSDKDQLITLERVVMFKNYKNLEGV